MKHHRNQKQKTPPEIPLNISKDMKWIADIFRKCADRAVRDLKKKN